MNRTNAAEGSGAMHCSSAIAFDGFIQGKAAASKLPDDQLIDGFPWVIGYLERLRERVRTESRYFFVRCDRCTWEGLSLHCDGGDPIADTGDYSELICPRCLAVNDSEIPVTHL